jgi:hypothetical protein
MTPDSAHEHEAVLFEVENSVDGDVLSPESGPPPLPGSIFLAERMERKRFLRTTSKSLFMGFVAVASGTASVMGFLASPAQAVGGCCPDCCGPSPCCNTSCCSKPCCSLNSYQCANNGSTCLGFDNTWGGSSCWSCQYAHTTTICCDCRVNNHQGCSNPNPDVYRCICYKSGPFAPPKGLALIRDASQVPTWN